MSNRSGPAGATWGRTSTVGFKPRAATMLAALALSAAVWGLGQSGEPFFPGIYTVDAFSQLLKIGLALGLLLALLASADLEDLRREGREDLPTFLFLGTLGMMLLVSATELLTLYVALEMSAYSLYVLVGLGDRPGKGAEAGVRYVVQGAVASGLTLFGLSLVYGLAGTTDLADIAHLSTSLAATPLGILAILLLLSGLLFKLAAFPFHAWVPDVYEGASHPVAAFVGTASKVAAVGVLARAATLVWDTPATFSGILAVLSVLSMSFGNLAALGQGDLKRLLGYSTIAHAGYVLIGLSAFTESGAASAIFYGMVYVPIAFSAFLVVVAVGRDGSNPGLDALGGLWRRSPLMALVLLVGMFGLAGIPPTSGFAGKWFLFTSAIERGGGGFWLVLIAAVNATISLYYYLQVVKAAWLAPGRQDAPALQLSPALKLAGALAIVGVLGSGLFPGPLWSLAQEAAQALTSLGSVAGP